MLDLLRMDERQFGWFFVPTIGGMVLGAWVSGRAAGRITGARLVGIGFAVSAVAAVFNVAYNLSTDVLQLPWAVVPMTLNAFGIALVFPILTLAVLDMYPRQRGSASSLQAFTALVSNALIAGVVSPWLSDDGLWLAVAADLFTAMDVAAARRRGCRIRSSQLAMRWSTGGSVIGEVAAIRHARASTKPAQARVSWTIPPR